VKKGGLWKKGFSPVSEHEYATQGGGISGGRTNQGEVKT